MTSTIVKVKSVKNWFYHLAGLLILPLNKIRHDIQGYRRPRPFPVSEIDTAIQYDLDVVKKYTDAVDVTNKNLLELGPGADLGVGLALIAKGAKNYFGLDIHNLAEKAPMELYKKMAEQLQRPELAELPENLHYVHDPSFNIAGLKDKHIDVVLSHAAFEHFDDVEDVIKQVSEVLQPGGMLVSEVDLQTHTRWIREEDPLNIYRYSEKIWNLFKFVGSPNRVRPTAYKSYLEKHGFTNIQILPVLELEDEYVKKVQNSLWGKFKQEKDLKVLSFMVLATKA